ncbi:N-acetylmuramoyl-L-alanine amidase [Amycolatopsis australiensis]|uniref:N-acetylmuramoyl-L-alanine amidase n=1 Tax=Amycolatopsis australiensis TaxID=546364 RepID=A0A1K1PFT9_9PSEU|nr:peptidoglycan recognition family protein [Amycolatopsis australiensis]SFW45542.1 N-acetylmuramoyl-L-alanine amidase [Amycolatopsis australiensis]
MSSHPLHRTAFLAAAIALTAGLAAAPAQSATQDQRQHDFAAAAKEFGVPENVLLGVSYLESRWDVHGGTPSTSAGYGPMHLTDVREAGAATSHHDEGTEDPRGDDARPALHPQAGPAAPPEGLQTVDEAAKLIGTDAATLRTNPAENIRGGAALLAKYHAGTTDWYDAVARYSGSTDQTAANAFADEVFETIKSGVSRTTDDGQQITLAATPDIPLPRRAANPADVECPRTVACESVPAPYQQLPGDDYGNHDLADRPVSQKIDHIVIHDTEGYWDSVLKLAQDPTYVSWHYTVRSNDGLIAQHVPTKDVAWHAGNWYVNSKSIGIEHEGFAAKGTWYTEAMYRSSAKLVGYLARKYGIPLDRAHIIGHDNVPGTVPSTIKGMHWDPGPYWDWSHYFDLLGAPLGGFGLPGSSLVTIDPDFARNQPVFTGCDTAGRPCAPRGSEAVVLHSEPSETAPLLKDAGLHPDGSASTMDVADVGSRVATGQQYAVAEVRGDWTAIWYLGQKGWFHNPRDARVAKPAFGWVVTPKPGLATVPVYGRAYPEPEAYPANVPVQAITPLPYTLAAGQQYSSAGTVGSEYYYAVTFDPAGHVVVKGKLKYVQIQFGHRIAFVKADDVRILPAF